MNTSPCGKKNPRRYWVHFLWFSLPSWKITSAKVPGPIFDVQKLQGYVENCQTHINLTIQESRRYVEKRQKHINFTIQESQRYAEKKIFFLNIAFHVPSWKTNPRRYNSKPSNFRSRQYLSMVARMDFGGCLSFL